MNENGIMEDYKQRLPALFKQILMMFKDQDAPSRKNSWLLHKLMKAFCRDIAHNLELVKAVDFISFLNGFLEADSVIQYPDFVMSSVSHMAAEVLSAHDNYNLLEAPAFFIIRSPLKFWMVIKGYRVDDTFRIYKRWVQQRSMLHLLDGVQFDVTQALVYCLASPHNFTRKFAGNYFVELIKFIYNECPGEAEDEVLCDIKSRLKSTIYNLIKQFNDVFIRSAGVIQCISSEVENCTSLEKPFIYYKKSAVNYCRLLSECAVTNDAWSRNYSETDMFDQLTALLQVIASDHDVDKNDLFRPSTVMLIRLITYSSASQNLKVKKLIKLLLHVSEIKDYSTCCDVVYMAGLILTQLKTQVEDQMLLLELSLLPLFVLFDVTPQSVLSSCPSAVEAMKSFLKTEQKSKPSALLKVAVDNLSNLDDVQINKTPYGPFIDYLELKRIDSPTEVGLSMLNGNNLTSDKFLNFLILKLSKVNLALNQTIDKNNIFDADQIYTLLDNVQSYTKVCLNYPSISSGQLFVVMDCYLAVLEHLKNIEPCKNKTFIPTAEDTDCVYNRHILQTVLQALQFKMFDIDPNIREVAVTFVGHMFLTVYHSSLIPEVSMDMCANLTILWQCVDNKTEGVAMKVLEFFLAAAESEHLEILLSFMNVTKADVITKINNFLLSCPWDNIKIVAFNLLTKIISQDLLVRYAEACLSQDNARLALAVLEYIQNIFLQQENNITLEQKVDWVASLFIKGWGDLILQKANAADICSFRKASSIMGKILAFMEQTDVCAIIDKRVSNFQLKTGISQNMDSENSHASFVKMCNDILKIHGHLDTSLQKLPTYKLTDQQEHVNLETNNFKPKEHQQMSTKKKSLEITNIDGGILAEKLQGCEYSAKHNLSSVCFLCILIDAEKIPKAEEHKRCTKISHVPEIKQISDKDEFYFDSAEEKIISSEDHDFYLDCTKEMPALSLRTEPFASQEQIQGILSHSIKCLDPTNLVSATGLLSWFAFLEMFRRLNPGILQEEAQCSTDEYERNSLTLLSDMDQVVARNFHSLQDKLEREIIMYFFDTFSKMLNTALNTADSKMRGDILKEVIYNLCIIMLMQQEEENVIKFILKSRRSILKIQSEDSKSQFVLDRYLDRLNFLNVQGSKGYLTELYTSAEGLKVLLQSYMKENTECNMARYYLMKSDVGYDTSSDLDLVVISNNVITILSNLCGEGSKAEIKESLEYLAAGETYFLNIILNGELEDLETTQAHLKTLLNSSSWEMFRPVVQLLQSLTKQLILVVCDRDDQMRQERYSQVAACFSQLENWFLAEDDEFGSEGEDDPTAIDCV